MLNALWWNLLLTAGLAVVLAALCRLPSMRKRPALRHWLWLLLLAKLVTPPLVAVPLLPAVAGSGDTAAIATPPSKPTGHRESALDRRSQANPAVDDTTSAFVDEGAGRDVGVATSRELRSGTQAPYLGGLLAVSLIGTCVLLTVHGVHAAKLYRWLGRAGTENSLLAESCTDVASRLEIRGVVRSCVVDARTTPLLWAWRQPLVVVPRQLVDDLNPQQLRSVVAHELAHLVRRDHWANVFVCMVKALLWWNPVVWWADRELRAAQELCCDAIAIDRCDGNRRGYATTLLKALDFVRAEPFAPREVAPGIGSRASILRRFEMIGETQLSYQLSRRTLLMLLALGIPLICIPVRGQEEGPAVSTTPAVVAEGGGGRVKSLQRLDHINASPMEEAGVYHISPVFKMLVKVTVIKRGGPYGPDHTRTLEGWDYDKKTGRLTVRGMVDNEREMVLVYGKRKVPWAWQMQEALSGVKVLIGKEAAVRGEDYEVDEAAGTVQFLKKEHCKKGVHYYISYGYRDEPSKGGSIGNHPDRALVRKFLGLHPTPDKRADVGKSIGTTERAHGKRPRGNCSISGKVISAETGKPIENARMHLFDNKTFGSIFMRTAADGTFKFKDIPTGPFSMESSHTAGYQDASYNPDGMPGYQFVSFSLEDGEQRSGIVLKVKRAYQISGKIVDENGKAPEDIQALSVMAWFERDDGKGYRSKQAIVKRADGSYSIDGLGDEPVYVMVNDWRAAKKADPYPPIYYPSTFSRNDAKQITFGEKRLVDNVNITLRKEGGLVLEGTVTDRETSAPIPKTLITVHHVDMLFDWVTAYTDEKGVYRVRGLGPGELAVHVDASPWGYVRTRKLVTLNGEEKTKNMDVSVRAGVAIHGKFVDQHGKDMDIYKNAYGLAFAEGYPTPESNSWSGVANRYAPADVFDRGRVTFNPDEGDYEEEYMVFPTKRSFVIPAMIPGKKKLRFHPKSEGFTVTKTLRGGEDVFQIGIELIAGEEVKNVVIMIGPSQEKADAEAP